MPKSLTRSHAEHEEESSSFSVCENVTDARSEKHDDGSGFLKDEVHVLQQRTKTGYEIKLKWLPGTVRHRNGKRLAEEVRGNALIIYAEDKHEALKLVRHGFMEWIINQQTQAYRQLINKLITLFEELQYERKEAMIDALTRLL